jgi:DNA-binding HxlR family transcriptional regulator
MPKEYGQACPVAKTLEIIGDRWTILIVRDLFQGRTKFAEFLEGLPGLAPNILSDRLKNLESNGIIAEHMYSDHPPRVEYKLTPKGKELAPVLGALFDWGTRHLHKEYALVNTDCGHEVHVGYFCPSCNEPSPSKRISRVLRKSLKK